MKQAAKRSPNDEAAFMPKSFGYKGGGLWDHAVHDSLASDREPNDDLISLIKELRNEGIGSRSFIITSLPGGEVMMLGKKDRKETNEVSVRLTGWSCTVLMP